MKFLSIIFLAAVASAAAVQPVEVRDVEAENASLEAAKGKGPVISGAPGKSINCGGKDPRASTYKVGQIKSTAQTAYDYVLSGKTVGANKYPHRYGYKDPHVKLSSACKKTDKNLYEFPIIGNGKYKGEDAKNIPDRIVVKQKSKKEAIYCGLITHTNAPAAPGVGAPFTSCSG